MTRVSVCMLAYNHAREMANSLDQLLNQSLQDFELILSDDCSPDPEMESIGRAYAQRDPRLHYFRNPQNLGRIANYNAAVARASGDYIAIVHDGDRYHPDLLMKWADALDRHPTAAFVFNAIEAIDWDGKHLRYFLHDYPPLIRGTDLLDEMLQRPDSPVFGMTMFRRSCWERVGPFDTRFNIIGDVDMWMRMALNFDVAYLREPLIGSLPREVNHDTGMRLWETLRENEEIHRINAERRYHDRPDQLRAAQKRIAALFLPVTVRQLLSCAKRRRGRLFREGLAHARSHPGMRLRMLAATLAPVLLFMPDR